MPAAVVGLVAELSVEQTSKLLALWVGLQPFEVAGTEWQGWFELKKNVYHINSESKVLKFKNMTTTCQSNVYKYVLYKRVSVQILGELQFYNIDTYSSSVSVEYAAVVVAVAGSVVATGIAAEPVGVVVVFVVAKQPLVAAALVAAALAAAALVVGLELVVVELVEIVVELVAPCFGSRFVEPSQSSSVNRASSL